MTPPGPRGRIHGRDISQPARTYGHPGGLPRHQGPALPVQVPDGTTPLDPDWPGCRKGGITKGSTMTNTPHTETPTTAVPDNEAPAGIEAFDLTPEGLADTPARQEDSGSIVHTGNS